MNFYYCAMLISGDSRREEKGGKKADFARIANYA
jgi:hypothetical protein